MAVAILLVLLGLGILIAGGEFLVRGAASLAKKMGIAPIVIGLTIVAFGTSAPELVVNIFSAIKGSTDIALGNIIGSNIANIFLILGVSAIIFPLQVNRTTVWKEIPFALLAVIMVFIMGNDILFDHAPAGVLTRSDGLALIAFFIIFLYYTFGISKIAKNEDNDVTVYGKPLSLVYIIGGLLALFFGGKLLVDNAVILARLAGLSEILIGSTIVAIGTSMPELVTSIIAAGRRQSDIAIGNIIGSNIFNIFWILGLTSVILPLPVHSALNTDIFINIVATLLLFLFMFIHSKHRLNRWQGVMFVLLYCVYTFMILSRG